MSLPKRYITTKNYHVVPILGLHPDDIKKSTKQVFRDREDIAHCTLLNLVASSFGISGGFAGYKEEYQHKLAPFMEKHGLQQWSNLITPQFTPDANAPLSLDVEKLADRFFFF
ncbi:hypothetical protein [Endozoicomonas lisbonensis]|uniref:Uncharacterized protein n=1 Tax=Endozoicomonas lisbonensis TaxID=3120522 RepID=A0ABV2SCB7_9GAMM